MIIRNDDVSVDTEMEDIKWFSELCDKYGFKILQCITPVGETHEIESTMSNDEIKENRRTIFENRDLIKFLEGRNDLIAVHGLWHTHEPSFDEIETAKKLIIELCPTYFVPPFNEGDYPEEVCGLKVNKLNLENGERLEDFLEGGLPNKPIMYLHSWRFGKMYNKEKLEICLKNIVASLKGDTTK